MLDFPASPSVGQRFNSGGTIWVYDGTKWTATQSGGAISLVIGDTPPSAPKAGDLWWDTVSAQMFIWYDDGNTQQWVVVVNQGGSYYPLGAAQVIGDNRLINGDMRIDQRNNGAVVTPVASAYTLDRWQYITNQASKINIQRATNAAPGLSLGIGYALNMATASAFTPAAGDAFTIVQPIEADLVADFAWGTPNAQPVTLSFWAQANVAGVYSGAITNAPNPPTRSYPFSFTLAAGGAWQKFVITIPGDVGGPWVLQGNAAGVQLFFDLGCGSNYRSTAGSWQAGNYRGVVGAVSIVTGASQVLVLANVKLEIGSLATPFNRQSLAKSLADCQRYFQTYTCFCGGYGGTGITYFGGLGALPVVMRAGPAITLGAVSNINNCTAQQINNIGLQGLYYQMVVTAAGIAYFQATPTFNAEL